MILPHHLSVERDCPFEGGERTRHCRCPVDRPVMKVGVAAMQQPAVSGVNRHAGMAPGVSGQRDHHDARRYLDELLGRSESAPLLTVRGVLDDLGSVGPLDRAKAKLLATCRCLQRSERLPRSDVDLGLGKIGDAADVVAVEVSNDDVAHVITAKAKLLNLIDGGLRRIQNWADQMPRGSHPPGWIAAILRSEAAVDQHQTVIGLDEQHVADHLAAPERVHGSAVEVVNLHRCSLVDGCPKRERPPLRRTACADAAARPSPNRTPRRRRSWRTG